MTGRQLPRSPGATAPSRPVARSTPAVGGRVSALAVVVLVLLAQLAVLGAPVVPAAAAPPTGPLVRIDIDRLTPAAAAPDDEITMEGRVTNITGAPLYNLQVLMWRNQAPYTDAEQLESVLDSDPDEPFGSPMINPGNFLDLTSSVASPDLQPSLDADASVPFTVTGTVEELGIPQYDAAYLLGAVVRGSTAADDPSRFIIGRARTLFPVLSTSGTPSTDLTSVVLLSSFPSQVAPRQFVDDHLATEVAEDGRLTSLLTSAARDDVSWAVDPDLIASLEAMAGGYQVRSGDRLVAGRGAVDAQRWLDAFDALDRRNGYRTDYAHPDLAAVAHQRATSVMSAARTAARAVERTRELPLLSLPADGLADQETLELALDSEPQVVLLSTASTGTSAIARADGRPVISFDADSFAGGPGPEPMTPVKLRQRMLTDAMLTAPSGRPVVRLITTADQAALDRVGQASFLRRTTLADLARQSPEIGYPELGVPADGPDELNGTQMARVTTLRRNFVAYRELLVDPGDVTERADQLLARAGSYSWRGREDDQQEFLEPTLDEIGGILSGDAVTLGEAVPTVLTGAGGSFPLTITNRLDSPVRVKVQVTSSNSSRLRVTQPAEVIVQPGERTQVAVEAEPASNGEVAVVAQLTTVSGTLLGKPTTRTVTVTQYGTVGWAIAVLAGAAFFLFSALRIRQVRRERARAGVPAAVAGLTSSVTAHELAASSSAPERRPAPPDDDADADGTGTVLTGEVHDTVRPAPPSPPPTGSPSTSGRRP